MMKLSPDSVLKNADWTKATWDLPYTSEEELKNGCPDYERFKRTPAYTMRPWAQAEEDSLQKGITLIPVAGLDIINRKGDV